jgi:GTP-binding protein
MKKRKDLRNIAIIAHVDHGKTTLVDSMFKQSGLFRENQAMDDCVLDSNDLERERGITILSKNTSVMIRDVRINIVDTPGHADFSGEVERVLSMVSGALVLVDAAEGPMPQTRFVLQKAMSLSLPLIIVINKADKPDANCERALENTLLLLMELGGEDEQLDSPVIYASGRDGRAGLSPDAMKDTLDDLFNAIIDHIPCPVGYLEKPIRMQVSSIDYNEYVGRIALGRIERGSLKIGDQVAICSSDREVNSKNTRITSIMQYEGLKRVPTDSASVGDIIALSGIEDIEIGDTICHPEYMEPLPVISVSEPTVAMTFMVNTSPFAGTEGTFVTSRQLWSRLEREIQSDVALRVRKTDRADSFEVSGRGELHLSILVETMRREGYEFMVSKPNVIVRVDEEGKKEPIERLVVDTPTEYTGTIMDKLNRRKGEMIDMTVEGDRTKLEFYMASRGLFGLRDEVLTDTRGEGIMSSVFDHYGLWRGEMQTHRSGVLVATETGQATAYALNAAQKRGILFASPGEKIYAGMIVGHGGRPEDIDLNVCRGKKLTNTRAAAKDDNVILSAPKVMTLEEKLLFLQDDEYLEVTPKALRLRKALLNKSERLRELSKKQEK